MFDWSSDDDTVPASSSSAFGITSSDIQDAHEFLESAKPDFSNENNSKDIVGEAWGGEKFSLKGKLEFSELIDHYEFVIHLSKGELS